jgi:hypothetical protein
MKGLYILTNTQKELRAKRLISARSVSSGYMLRILWERFNTEFAWLLVCVMFAGIVYVRMAR